MKKIIITLFIVIFILVIIILGTFRLLSHETEFICDNINANDVNNLINDYLKHENIDKSNIVFNYVDEENNKVIVELVDASDERQKEFIYQVFTSCCGSKYINCLKEREIIMFIEMNNN